MRAVILDCEELAVGALCHEVAGIGETHRILEHCERVGVAHLDPAVLCRGDEGPAVGGERPGRAVDDAQAGTGLEVPERRGPRALIADHEPAPVGRHEEDQWDAIALCAADHEEILGTGVARAQVPTHDAARVADREERAVVGRVEEAVGGAFGAGVQGPTDPPAGGDVPHRDCPRHAADREQAAVAVEQRSDPADGRAVEAAHDPPGEGVEEPDDAVDAGNRHELPVGAEVRVGARPGLQCEGGVHALE